MSYQWDWEVFLRDTGADETYFDWMMSAWGWTLSVAGCAWVIALVVGALIGTIRTVPHKGLQWLGNAWVELFRNIPVLVQVFLWYHVIPALVPPLQGLSTFVLVIFALGFFTSARVAEQVRAGIQALQPMAFRIVIPPLTSEAMNIIKNSSVAFAVSISELTLFAMQVQEETSRGIEVYLAVTTLYIISAFAVNRVMAFIEARVRVPGYVGGGK
jgi:glutamate/aspartate transport system permease protein